jgi:hypothetical protein
MKVRYFSTVQHKLPTVPQKGQRLSLTIRQTPKNEVKVAMVYFCISLDISLANSIKNLECRYAKNSACVDSIK